MSPSSSRSPTVPTGSSATPEAGAPAKSEPPAGFRRLFRDLLIYGAGGIGLQFVGFVSVPVLTRIFTRSEYGAVETIATMSLVIGVLAILGLDSASQRSFFQMFIVVILVCFVPFILAKTLPACDQTRPK